jgi:hypothetical protein
MVDTLRFPVFPTMHLTLNLDQEQKGKKIPGLGMFASLPDIVQAIFARVYDLLLFESCTVARLFHSLECSVTNAPTAWAKLLQY